MWMQSFSSGIWTRVAVSISYDDNNYTTGTCFGVLGNAKYSFIATTPWSTLIPMLSPDKIQWMGQIEPFDFETVCKQMTYA